MEERTAKNRRTVAAAMAQPHVLLAAANAVWLLGGVLAYFTRASLVLATAIAVVPALPALLEMRRQSPSAWLDRALAGALGTWTVMAVLIVTPYVASESVSLWTSRGFAGTALVAASVGMLLWNLAAFLAAGGDKRTARLYSLLHLVTLAVAIYLVVTGDGARSEVELRGTTFAVVDLQAAPAVAALAGLPWAAAMLRPGRATADPETA